MVKFGEIMGKVKQKNWLIIITILMVISSGVVLFISLREKIGFKTCAYGENVYIPGQNIPNFNGLEDCYCAKDGSVKCGNSSDVISYSSFSSSGLFFSSRFLNYLEKEKVENNIIPMDVNYNSDKFSLIFEREVLCGDNSLAPVQIGFYKIEEGNLIVTVMTNRDPELYSMVCKVENTIAVDGINLDVKDTFKIYYQDEYGYRYDLKVCPSNGKLYNSGDMLEVQGSSNICYCDEGVIKCEN
jgi:hypothetical protein